MAYDAFLLLLKAHGLPAPQTEFVFAPPRKFRADYCWPEAMVIVERQGGLFMKRAKSGGRGAHALPTNILRDYEKSNLAQLAGWTYLQYTPRELESGAVLPVLKIVLRPTEPHSR